MVKQLNASPEYHQTPNSPLTDSDPLSPSQILNQKNKSPLTSPSSSSLKPKGKKKLGTRGKCRGCIKRDAIIESHKLFRRNVQKKCDRMEEQSTQLMGCFFQLQEYLDIAGPMAVEVGKLAKQLSESATINPTQYDIIDLDKSP